MSDSNESYTIKELNGRLDQFMKHLNLEGFTKIDTKYNIIQTFNDIHKFIEYCENEEIDSCALSEHSYEIRFGNKYITITYEVEFSIETNFYVCAYILIDNNGELEDYGVHNTKLPSIITNIYNKYKNELSQSLIKSARS